MNREKQVDASMHIALFMRSLQGSGGAERVMVQLAQGLVEQGHRVDLVMARQKGHFFDQIPDAVRLVDLKVRTPFESLRRVFSLGNDTGFWLRMLLSRKPHFVLGALPGLTRYLRKKRPDAVITAMDYPNVVGIAAKKLAGLDSPVIATIHNTLSVEVAHSQRRRIREQPRVNQHFYPRADALVAVSKGVAEDLERTLSLPDGKITTIYNPVVPPTLEKQAEQPLNHPWFADGEPPVVLAVGGFKPQKDFATLLRAFAKARKRRPMRLLILGEGKLRPSITSLAEELDIVADLAMPGFVDNPFQYLARADVFALSSRWEGLPTVVIEALACGCPVVSTDCPSGPAEILENGRYGTLVPVGDPEALAVAILETLATPTDRQRLRERGAMFSVENATRQYLDLIGDLRQTR
jgi:glycosyltransferase involved in cell wall biosynthesis